MKVIYSLIVASSLLVGGAANAETGPSDKQINRYYAAMAGVDTIAADKPEKSAARNGYETETEMMEDLREAYPNLDSESFMKKFFEFRLQAIVDASKKA